MDLALHLDAESAWILEGTGLGNGDALPGAINYFASGNLIEFDGGGMPFLVDLELTRSPAETRVWGTAPSNDARAWWLAEGRPLWMWPRFDGHATATLQQRPSGATVVTLPNQQMVNSYLVDPIYERLVLNLMERLSIRGG